MPEEESKITNYLLKIRHGITTLLPVDSITPDDIGEGEGRVRGERIQEALDYALVLAKAMQSSSVVILNQATNFIKNLRRDDSSHKN